MVDSLLLNAAQLKAVNDAWAIDSTTYWGILITWFLLWCISFSGPIAIPFVWLANLSIILLLGIYSGLNFINVL